MLNKIIENIFDTDAIAQYREEEHAVAGDVVASSLDTMFIETEVSEIEATLREIIATEYPAVPLDSTDLVDERFIDSLTILSLASIISERYGVEITYNEIAPENFNSVHAMAQLVARLMKKSVAGSGLHNLSSDSADQPAKDGRLLPIGKA